ncbi:hypothetical protein [Methylobacterium sp. AMS5]|uniref:hypothetical protein n=1 Tax=Methylobacterium sp. AMS5 TaxID=925818 RepID=UPI00118749DC|nr:hypothetical protein [Methylobacterium sp. AMS5]
MPALSVPDLARIEGNTDEVAAHWIINYFNEPGGTFNYARGMRSIKASYNGLHNIEQLKLACNLEKTEIGRRSNKELVSVVAPEAFKRTTQVFDLPAKKFTFGHRQAGFRVPFFFVEGGIVKICFIWPRKGISLSSRQIGMIATILKNYLLDTEFFGLPTDIEFIEASAPKGCKERSVDRLKLSEIELWSETDLTDRLTLISNALTIAENSGKIKPKKRKAQDIAPDMPLFD